MNIYDLVSKLNEIEKEILEYEHLLNKIENIYFRQNLRVKEKDRALSGFIINNHIYINKKLAELNDKKNYIVNILSNIQIDDNVLDKLQ